MRARDRWALAEEAVQTPFLRDLIRRANVDEHHVIGRVSRLLEEHSIGATDEALLLEIARAFAVGFMDGFVDGKTAT